jgi:hypothetical protein
MRPDLGEGGAQHVRPLPGSARCGWTRRRGGRGRPPPGRR